MHLNYIIVLALSVKNHLYWLFQILSDKEIKKSEILVYMTTHYLIPELEKSQLVGGYL